MVLFSFGSKKKETKKTNIENQIINNTGKKITTSTNTTGQNPTTPTNNKGQKSPTNNTKKNLSTTTQQSCNCKCNKSTTKERQTKFIRIGNYGIETNNTTKKNTNTTTIKRISNGNNNTEEEKKGIEKSIKNRISSFGKGISSVFKSKNKPKANNNNKKNTTTKATRINN